MNRSVDPPSPVRVLLVEDYLDLAEATAEFLMLEGFDVRIATSGAQALKMAPAWRPQLLLCDLNLPDISGLDVIRTLQSSPATERPYAVILTAMATGALSAGLPGVDAIVSKPLTLEAIRTLKEKVGDLTAFRDEP